MEHSDRADDPQTSVLTPSSAAKDNPQLDAQEAVMRWTIFADKKFPNDWHVEAIDRESGDIYVAVFSGPDAENRARKYADWQQSQLQRTAA